MKTYGLSHEQFAMVDGGGALILVAADRAGITGPKAFAEARTAHQEFYCTGSRRVQRTSSRINIKMAVELSAGKSAYPARSRRILRRLTIHLYHAIAAGTSAEMLRNTEHRRVH